MTLNGDRARGMLFEPRDWTTAGHTLVEDRRSLGRAFGGSGLETFRRWFEHDRTELSDVALCERVCVKSAELAESTGVRTLDVLHLGAAWAEGADDGLPIVTFDRRLAAAPRWLGWTVLGAE